MIRRMRKAGVLVLALGSLALGGAVFAQAQGGSQQNAQPAATSGESTSGPDTDTIQSGDQSAPDPGSEVADESGPQSDGPGGHADPSGSADHQFQGQE